MTKPYLIEKETFKYEDIDSLPEGNYEVINGERRDMTPTSFEHGDLKGLFYELLRKYFKDKGYIAVGEVGIIKRRNLSQSGQQILCTLAKRNPLNGQRDCWRFHPIL